MLALIDIIVTAVVAGVLGFLAGAFTVATAKRGARSLAADPALPGAGKVDILAATIKDVRKGGLVHVSNMGDAGEDVDLEVERYDRHVAGRDEWHLLDGTYATRHVGLEWQEVRGVLRLWEHKRLRALTPEQVGLEPDRGGAALGALAVGKEHAHDGVTYVVETAGKALRHENGSGFGKEYEAWRLVSKDGKRVLHVERWGDKPASAWIGEAADPSVCTIYRVKA
jgi:hypothetical protein